MHAQGLTQRAVVGCAGNLDFVWMKPVHRSWEPWPEGKHLVDTPGPAGCSPGWTAPSSRSLSTLLPVRTPFSFSSLGFAFFFLFSFLSFLAGAFSMLSICPVPECQHL